MLVEVGRWRVLVESVHPLVGVHHYHHHQLVEEVGDLVLFVLVDQHPIEIVLLLPIIDQQVWCNWLLVVLVVLLLVAMVDIPNDHSDKEIAVVVGNAFLVGGLVPISHRVWYKWEAPQVVLVLVLVGRVGICQRGVEIVDLTVDHPTTIATTTLSTVYHPLVRIPPMTGTFYWTTTMRRVAITVYLLVGLPHRMGLEGTPAVEVLEHDEQVPMQLQRVPAVVSLWFVKLAIRTIKPYHPPRGHPPKIISPSGVGSTMHNRYERVTINW
jgi:hypothetical protein